MDELNILGHFSAVSEAPEPTNVKWENYGFAVKQRKIRMVAIFLILLGILMINYFLTKTAEDLTISAVGKYDYSMSCDSLDLIYSKTIL